MEIRPEGFMQERAAESGDAKKRLIDHWQKNGNLDAPGVSDDEKRRFANEQAELYEREIRKLADKMAELEKEKVGWIQQAALVEIAAEDRETEKAARQPFTPEELEWFKEGEDENHMALQERWEVNGSLDVDEDDITYAEKLLFAKKKKAQLEAALKAGHVQADDPLKERLLKLDIFIAQYGK